MKIGEQVFTEKNFILFSFLLLQTITLIYRSFYSNESEPIPLLGLAVFLVYTVLSFLTYKKHKIATIILAILIAVSGIWAVALAVAFMVGRDQEAFTIFSIISGIYFTICGIRLLMIHNRERGNLKS